MMIMHLPVATDSDVSLEDDRPILEDAIISQEIDLIRLLEDIELATHAPSGILEASHPDVCFCHLGSQTIVREPSSA